MSRGFTLVEMLIALLILAVAIAGVLFAGVTSRSMTAARHERVVALQDAGRVIELMRDASASGNFPANVLAAYPDGGAVAGFNNLSGEQLVVTYLDTAADPLDVTVTANWLEQGSRAVTARLETLMTQRE